ncbi:hypothetical protein [Sphingorhabdus sp. EL138]|uniref:hypothetical protein n=1 Tax=Sphingorhabdus sp. EL138 TaxID=2073156 RepID=UPI000D689791|nr:hypothetical protein [Sphingorhabdus sp. EL138]
MVLKTGNLLPKSSIRITDGDLSAAVSKALMSELGGSRRATKTVMRWTSVSERTARSWINGVTSPSGIHLVLLSAHCKTVLIAFLKLGGHHKMVANVDLVAAEAAIENVLKTIRMLQSDQ